MFVFWRLGDWAFFFVPPHFLITVVFFYGGVGVVLVVDE
jgi:hypothetical protein